MVSYCSRLAAGQAEIGVRDPALRAYGGHVGYDVRPSAVGRGHNPVAMRLSYEASGAGW